MLDRLLRMNSCKIMTSNLSGLFGGKVVLAFKFKDLFGIQIRPFLKKKKNQQETYKSCVNLFMRMNKYIISNICGFLYFTHIHQPFPLIV